MALSFTNAVGNLFNRLGSIFYAFRDLDTVQSATIPTDYQGIADEFTANRPYAADLQNQLVAAQNSTGQPKTYLQSLSGSVLTSMVQADNPQPSATLDFSIPELIRQMNAGSQTVDANTVTATAAAGASNSGNGSMIVSVVDGKGRSLENIVAEAIKATCTSDSQPGTGGSTLGSETFTAQGAVAVPKTDYRWPGGSGGNTQVKVSNPTVDASTPQNLLTNGDFENFTANAPDNWTIVTGAAGTTVTSTATVYLGSKALSIVGNGTQRTRIAQSLRSAPTTAGPVIPLTRYAFGVRLRVSSVPAAGVLRIALRDGTTDGATVIGGASITVTLSGATTGYVLYTCQFNAPAVLPDSIYAVVELTAALDNAKSVYIDALVLTQMVQHQNGVLMSIMRGSTKFIAGDYFTITTTNDRAGLIQEFFNRMFGMDDRKLLLPSDAYGAETIPDTVVSV